MAVKSRINRLRGHPALASKATERLAAAAIMRGGDVLERGFRSHWELRQALKPGLIDYSRGEPGDIEGFVTSNGRFVNRHEAKDIAIAAGQIHERWKNSGRDLLSSDIDW
jgi:hypothetical protein